jgi:hypothetical protein
VTRINNDVLSFNWAPDQPRVVVKSTETLGQALAPRDQSQVSGSCRTRNHHRCSGTRRVPHGGGIRPCLCPCHKEKT